MLTPPDYARIKTALKLIHSMDKRNPKPLIALMKKQQPTHDRFSPGFSLNEIILAASEIVLNSPESKARTARLEGIGQALKEGSNEALTRCIYSKGALELIYRIGILQFDQVADEIIWPIDSDYWNALSHALRSTNYGSRPGIRSKEIHPRYAEYYDTQSKLKTMLDSKPQDTYGRY
jgi:hypothetical protein